MQQKIYSKEFHKLEASSIDKEALYILEKLTTAGHVAYLVGGGVRDLLLGRKPKDYDISTSAEPETIKKLFRNCILIGRRFRLAHIRFGKKTIEVSTFRSGDNENDALIIRDNEWGSPEEDVLRRDFTINGLFYNAQEETVIDYVDGFQDLENGLLRTIGQPFIRFKQDPVRMLRLLKFRARFGLSVDPIADTALLESKHEILKSSSARILEELLRMLESGAAESFFRLLIEYGFLQLILPALADFMESPESEEIFSFLKVIDTLVAEEQTLDRSLPLTALIFPLFERRLETLFSGRSKPPHLGEIQNEAYALFDESFDSFFKIPKRIKMMVVSILTAQMRLTPFDKKKPRSFRIPNDPNFRLAVNFLQIRTRIDSSFSKRLQEWIKVLPPASEDPTPINTRKRRPRRRSSPKKNTESS